MDMAILLSANMCIETGQTDLPFKFALITASKMRRLVSGRVVKEL